MEALLLETRLTSDILDISANNLIVAFRLDKVLYSHHSKSPRRHEVFRSFITHAFNAPTWLASIQAQVDGVDSL